MTAAPNTPRRILIGAGSFADARAAFRLAEQLARNLTAELGGMLVEESALAELAELPRQRVITSSGTFVVAPSRSQIRTVIDSDAEAFRQMLSAMGQSRKWSFERRRGELISGLFEAAKGWDVLLLGHCKTYRFPGRVVLIAPPANVSQPAKDLAEVLASSLGTGTLRLSLAPAPPQSPEEQPDTEWFATVDALLARVGRIAASAVVLDLSVGPLRTPDELRRVLAAARCPVVVLGAGKGEPPLEHSTQIPPAPGSAN